MIEQQLQRIADALTQIATVLTNAPGVDAQIGMAPKEVVEISIMPDVDPVPAAPKKTRAAKKTEAPEPAKAVTLEDIGGALRAFVTKNGKDGAVRILKQYNAARLSELKPEDYGKVLADLTV